MNSTPTARDTTYRFVADDSAHRLDVLTNDGVVGLQVRAHDAQGFTEGPVFLQRTGASGTISMEAENFESLTPSLDERHKWRRVIHLPDDSAESAMRILPVALGEWSGNWAETAPAITYRFYAQRTGTLYLWLRGFALRESKANVHVGLDGVGLDGAALLDAPGFRISVGATLGWTPISYAMDIATPVLHRLHLFGNAAGVGLDKAVLAWNPEQTPAAQGPEESRRLAP